jgi:alkylation response protein AidB-like acyl-CoA dehydrogenase
MSGGKFRLVDFLFRFLVQGMNGLTAPPIKNKLALRASITGSIFMDTVKIPKENLMPHGVGLKAPFSCLNNARYGISWGVIGALEDCIARAREYTLERWVTQPSTQKSKESTSYVVFAL